MENNLRPALGERLRQIRDAKGMSIETLAQEINSNKSTVSRIERGETSVSAENMAKIRKALGIEKVPLLEHELQLYKDRLWVWNDLLEADRVADARAMQEEMAVLLDVPFEHDLYTLYHAIGLWLLCRENKHQQRARHKYDFRQYWRPLFKKRGLQGKHQILRPGTRP